MYVRALGIIALVALVALLVRRLRPSRFGLVFGLLLLYLPLHFRAPLNVLPMVNALTAFLFALVLLVPTGSRRLGKRARELQTVTLAFLAISLIGLAISLSAGKAPEDLLVVFKRWVDPALFGLLALSLIRDEDRRFAVACVAVGFVLVGVHAVREGFDYGALKRIPGLLGQVNETAAFLAMYAPVVLAVALLFTRGSVRIALLAAVAVAACGLVFTESRGGMVGYALGVLTTLFASKRTAFAVTGLIIVGVVFVVPEILPERVVTRFESTIEEGSPLDPSDDTFEPSTADRLRQWTAGLTAIIGNPLGVGLDRFKETIASSGGIRGLDAHNFFVLVGVELGLVGLALVVVLFVKIGLNAWVVAHNAHDPFTRALGVGALGMLVAAIVVNFFGSRLMQEQPSTYFWVLAAMASRFPGVPPTITPVKAIPESAPVRRWRVP